MNMGVEGKVVRRGSSDRCVVGGISRIVNKGFTYPCNTSLDQYSHH